MDGYSESVSNLKKIPKNNPYHQIWCSLFKTCFPDRNQSWYKKIHKKHKGLPSSYKDVRKGLKIEAYVRLISNIFVWNRRIKKVDILIPYRIVYTSMNTQQINRYSDFGSVMLIMVSFCQIQEVTFFIIWMIVMERDHTQCTLNLN